MKKFNKIIGTAATFGLLMSGLGAIASAATYYTYDTIVPVYNDYESSGRTKETTGSAYNKVSTIQKE